MKVERREGRIVLIFDTLAEARLAHESFHAQQLAISILGLRNANLDLTTFKHFSETMKRFCEALDDETKSHTARCESASKTVASELLAAARKEEP